MDLKKFDLLSPQVHPNGLLGLLNNHFVDPCTPNSEPVLWIDARFRSGKYLREHIIHHASFIYFLSKRRTKQQILDDHANNLDQGIEPDIVHFEMSPSRLITERIEISLSQALDFHKIVEEFLARKIKD